MSIEEKVISILKDNGTLHITQLLILLPEIKGDFQIKVVAKKGYNPNIILISGVSEDFCAALENLFDNKLISWHPVNSWEFLLDGSPIYKNLPVATAELAKTKKECWLPVSIKLTER